MDGVAGELLNGRYELLERIGGGSMGEVWRGRDLVLGRPVAVKILLPMLLEVPAFRERFAAEARILARVDHAGVVGVFDYGVTVGPDGRDTAYMVMEFLEGEPLDQVLQRRGQLDHVAALDVLGQLLDALAAVHRQGIVHRDVKPANVMVRAGRAVLADFGIARSPEASGLTADDTLLGTVPYLAPELFRNEAITPAVDVYAVGILGYELLSGHPPFRGDSTAAVMYMHVYEAPPPLPDHVPEPIEALLQRALAKDPDDRWPDAGAMAAAVRAAISEDEFPQPGTGLNPEPELRSRTGATRVLTGAALAVASTDATGVAPVAKPAQRPRMLIPVIAAAATVLVAVAAVLMNSGSSTAHDAGTGGDHRSVASSGPPTFDGGVQNPSLSGLEPTSSGASHRTRSSGASTAGGSGTKTTSAKPGSTPVSGQPSGSGTPQGSPPSGIGTTSQVSATSATSAVTSQTVTGTTSAASVTVPDVTGSGTDVPEQTAKDKLLAKGFAVNVVPTSPQGGQACYVTSQSPLANTQQPLGSTVTIYVSCT